MKFNASLFLKAGEITMPDGTNVGKIYLEFDLSQGLQQQISETANQVSTGLKEGIEKNFNLNNLLNPLKAQVNSITTTINKSLDDLQARMKAITGMTPGAAISTPSKESAAPATLPKISVGGNLEAIKAQIDSLSASLEVTNRMIEQQQAKLAMLKEQYSMTFDETKKNKLEEQILRTEARINKLIITSDAAGFKLADLDAQFQALSSGAKSAAASVDNVSSKLSETGKRATAAGNGISIAMNKATLSTSMLGRMLDRMLLRMVIFNTAIRAITNFTKFLGSALMTNTAFSNSLAQIKSNLEIAFMPIYQAALPAITSLMQTLAVATTYVAAFISALFGKTYQASAGAAKGLNIAIDAQKALEDQTKKTNAALKGSIASFDEINQLSIKTPEVNTLPGAGGGMLTTPIVAPPIDTSAIDAAMQKIKDVLSKIGSFLKPIEDYIREIGSRFKETYNSVKPSLDIIAQHLNEVGIPAWKAYKLAAGDVADLFKGHLFNGFTIVEGVLKITADLLKGDFKKAWDDLKDTFKKLDLKGLGDAFYFIMNPIGFVTNKLLDHLGVWEKVKSVWDNIKVKASVIFENVKTTIVTKFNEIKDKTMAIWEAVRTTISEKWEAIKAFDWGNIKEKLSGYWNELSTNTQSKWDSIGGAISEKWGTIKGFDWDYVKDAVSTAWKGLQTLTQTIWSSIVDTIKNSINSVIAKINKFIDKLNSLEIKVPDIKIPLLGTIEGFSIGLPHIPNINYLANGGLIDQPTLAMIGETKRKEAVIPLENQSVMQEIGAAVANAMLSVIRLNSGGNNQSSDRPIEVVLNIDGTRFARAILPYTDKERDRIGTKAILKMV